MKENRTIEINNQIEKFHKPFKNQVKFPLNSIKRFHNREPRASVSPRNFKYFQLLALCSPICGCTNKLAPRES